MTSDVFAFRYAFGVEWKNSRGQVFVNLHDEHPHARGDGFYARAKFVMEEQLKAGNTKPYDPERDGDPSGKGPLTWKQMDLTVIDPYLDPAMRVYHIDGDPSNDDPSNLILFPSQKALAQYRSMEYHKSKDQNYRDRLKGLTEEQKERRELFGTERAQQMERRSAAAKRAVRDRKAREKAAAKEAADGTV